MIRSRGRTDTVVPSVNGFGDSGGLGGGLATPWPLTLIPFVLSPVREALPSVSVDPAKKNSSMVRSSSVGEEGSTLEPFDIYRTDGFEGPNVTRNRVDPTRATPCITGSDMATSKAREVSVISPWMSSTYSFTT